jgi:dihydroorotate dehydrogenase electron transfer subunit
LKQVSAPVISNSEVMPGVYVVWLKAPSIASEARPGQFIMVRCGENTSVPRPFSVHRRNSDEIALLFSVVGKGTGWLSQCKTGDRLDIFGPLGNGFSVNPESHNLLLVAGGMGIAPLHFLAEEMLKQGTSVRLLYGTAGIYRYPEENLPSGINLVAATEDGSVGHHGMVTGLLPDYLDRADQVFACGPLAMYRDMLDNYPQLVDKQVQVSLEVRMGCGRGVCYGCTIKTKSGQKRVCEHGPVFDLNDILWDELGY